MRSWQRAVQIPWLALLLLVVLFDLPSMLLPEPVRPTGELLVLLGAGLLSWRLHPLVGGPLRWLLGLCGILLALARVDRIVFLELMGEEPLLYDQFFMLRHLFVLFGDIWSWGAAAAVTFGLLALALTIVVVRLLLRASRGVLEPERRASARVLAATLFACVLLGSFLPVDGTRVVRWMTPALLDNIAQSRRIYAGVQRELGRSPYRAYRTLTLRRKPDVYLIFVESYGRVIAERPSMRGRWTNQVRHMERVLGGAGWHAVSAFSRAPVMGGRSWLAEGSVLMGTHVGYEAVFHHLVGQIDRVPNLVGFLAQQGYHTVLLAPADRRRRGVEEVNYYRTQRSVRLGDLGYRGPKLGWGIVPDQYSLGFTDEHVLRDTPRPLFFDFHMVSSHAPWENVPPLVADWRSLNDGPRAFIDEPNSTSAFQRLRRYVHNQRRFAYRGQLLDAVGQSYEATILYDLSVLERYIAQLSGDALVIVMGDHQPPFIAAETRSFDTPVHVLARDAGLLDELRDHGFQDGLWLGPSYITAIRHEGLFSLLARTLARCCTEQKQLPVYLPKGSDLGS